MLTADEYAAHMDMLGLTHQQIADRLGVSRWTSMSWRMGRRPVPLFAEVGLRALHYQRVAGDLAAHEVERRFEQARNAGPARSQQRGRRKRATA